LYAKFVSIIPNLESKLYHQLVIAAFFKVIRMHLGIFSGAPHFHQQGRRKVRPTKSSFQLWA
jgi:hypothetical protein